MIFKKNKKAISIMVGYVLLIVTALVMAGIVYAWMKTNISPEEIKCNEGVSVFVKDLICTNESTYYTLNLTFINNGRFNIAGYKIYATNYSNYTIDLSSNADKGLIYQNSLIFDPGNNYIKVQDGATNNFSFISQIYSVEVIPVIFQKDYEKNRKDIFKVCGDAKVKEKINCYKCGNGGIEVGEVCECGDDGICGNIGDDLNGEDCMSRGFTGGDLYCLSGCLEFNITDCT